METRNYTLDNALAQASQPIGLIENPFPDITAQGAPQSPPITTSQALGTSALGFEEMAKRLSFDVKGINQSAGVGKLQLMTRLEKQFGPDYQQNSQAQALIEAFMRQRTGIDELRASRTSTAAAERTLKGMGLGVAPR